MLVDPSEIGRRSARIADQVRAGTTVEFGIAVKWMRDARRLPLMRDQWPLYRNIHRACWLKRRSFPNLVDGKDFNDQVQWLKLFDQSEAIVRCVDKVRVRDHVRERVGSRYLTDLYDVADDARNIDLEALPQSFVIKSNHDSGSTVLVRDKARVDREAVCARMNRALTSGYGFRNGEWAYALVPRRIMVEEYIAPEQPSPPPDYKFFVVEGRVRFMLYIRHDRDGRTWQQSVDPDGRDLGLPLYRAFEYGGNFERPAYWDEMIALAERLGEGFKYVRVDLFNVRGRIYAGEMTFWPGSGFCFGDGQRELARICEFDRSSFKPPVYRRLLAAQRRGHAIN